MFSMMLQVTAVIFWWLVFRAHSLSMGFALMRSSPLSRCIMLGLLIFFLIFVSGGLMAYTQTLSSVRPSRWENKTLEIQGLFSNQLQLSLIDKHQHNAFVRLWMTHSWPFTVSPVKFSDGFWEQVLVHVVKKQTKKKQTCALFLKSTAQSFQIGILYYKDL